MNKIFNCLLAVAASLVLFSCEKDNYNPPSSLFKGRLVYNGDPIGVAYKEVSFNLIEPGFARVYPIQVMVAPDGSYSIILFDSNYKLYFPANQGPYLPKMNAETSSDTILLNLRGSQTMDIEVLPYYMVRDTKASVAARTVTMSCRLEKIITDINAKDIESVFLYVNKTSFVDTENSLIAPTTLEGGSITDLNNVMLSIEVPSDKLNNPTPQAYSSQNYVYARIGVKIRNVQKLLYSPVQKVQF